MACSSASTEVKSKKHRYNGIFNLQKTFCSNFAKRTFIVLKRNICKIKWIHENFSSISQGIELSTFHWWRSWGVEEQKHQVAVLQRTSNSLLGRESQLAKWRTWSWTAPNGAEVWRTWTGARRRCEMCVEDVNGYGMVRFCLGYAYVAPATKKEGKDCLSLYVYSVVGKKQKQKKSQSILRLDRTQGLVLNHAHGRPLG